MKVWFITGASRGLGRAFAEAALAAGDRVVAAARDLGPLDALAEPLLRLIVGGASFDLVRRLDEARAAEYARWEHLSRQAPG